MASTCGKSARFKEKGMFSARCFFRPRVEQKVATVAKGPALFGRFLLEFVSPLAVSAFWSGKLVS